jgi:Protein of Unknown function (DUF2784)
MTTKQWEILAEGVLAIHLLWIIWVILGWLVTPRRPWLRWSHIGSLIYGILIEILGPPCPLTIAEQWLEGRAGIQPYHEPFLVHYLEAIVYPNVSQTLLVSCAVAVCLVILAIYVIRFRRRKAVGSW